MVPLSSQTAEYGSFRRDLRCGEGTNLRRRCAKQLPSADEGAKVTKYVLKRMKIRALGADLIWEKEGRCANFFL